MINQSMNKPVYTVELTNLSTILQHQAIINRLAIGKLKEIALSADELESYYTLLGKYIDDFLLIDYSLKNQESDLPYFKQIFKLHSVAAQLGCERLQTIVSCLANLTPEETDEFLPKVKNLIRHEKNLLAFEMHGLFDKQSFELH